MAYSQQTWHDLPALDTPITAARLGAIEAGIAAAYDRVSTVATAGTAQALPVPTVATVNDLTLTSASCAITLPSGFGDAQAIMLLLRQDATGGRAVTFSPVTWLGDGTQPTLAVSPGGTTILTFFTVNGGSTWFGSGTVESVPSSHHATHQPGGTDAIDLTTIDRRGVLGSRPSAAASLAGVRYFATDDRGGTEYRCDGTIWLQVGRSLASGLKPSSFNYVTYPREGSSASSQTPLTSGQLLMVAIDLPVGFVVNSITFWSGASALATGTNQWFALFDSSRVKLGISADDTSTAWAANAAKTLNLSAPFTTTYSGLHYLGIMVAATTPPSLITTNSSGTLYGITPIICGTADSSLTNPASCPSTAAALTASGKAPFAAVA